MFRALFVHHQAVLNKRYLVYFVRVLSVGFTRMIKRTNIPSTACLAPPEDKQVMLETCIGP
jgi:hypothetical protein